MRFKDAIGCISTLRLFNDEKRLMQVLDCMSYKEASKKLGCSPQYVHYLVKHVIKYRERVK